jgi:hypothetical protein
MFLSNRNFLNYALNVKFLIKKIIIVIFKNKKIKIII